MKKLITLVLLLAAFAVPAAAQSQQDLINAYRNGTLTQSQIDNAQKQGTQVNRNRQVTNQAAMNNKTQQKPMGVQPIPMGKLDKEEDDNQQKIQQTGYYDKDGRFIPGIQYIQMPDGTYRFNTKDPRYKLLKMQSEGFDPNKGRLELDADFHKRDSLLKLMPELVDMIELSSDWPKIFGKDLLSAGSSMTFEPNLSIATPDNYVLGAGDEVITSAYTYTASASVIAHVGAKVVLIDTQEDSLEMDYDALEAAINEKTKAIIPVDLAGIPCNYNRLFDIVQRKKALFRPNNDIQAAIGRVAIMADTAHAFGAKWHDRMIGSVADFSSFSFHAVKNLTTAEGGALTWKTIPGISDEDIYKKLQLLSLHGQSKDALAKTKLGAWEYDIVGTYYKCNMTDVVAAIGLKQFERYPNMLMRRKEIIGSYDAALLP